MKLLLINPNRYRKPPVPPIGLEYVAGFLEAEGHKTEVLDLCFSEKPLDDIDRAARSFLPEAVGITVRNIDSVLYQANEFYLDEIRGFIEYIKTTFDLEVIIGGAAISANPEGVLEYLNADYAISGPAEDVISEVINDIQNNNRSRRIYRRKYGYEISCPRKMAIKDYRIYADHGGIAGFETHKGCGSSCIYCIEADTPVAFRRPREVIDEIRQLVNSGFSRFHLCDAEFNEDIDYCLDFCAELRGSGMEIDWSAYMKPSQYNKKLVRVLKDTGLSLITLTVDSWKKCPLYWSDIERLIFSAKSCGIKVLVDFLTGFPYEEEDTLLWYLDMFRRLQPDGVSINTYIRLYKSTRITELILNDSRLKKYLIGNTGELSMIMPVFYNQINPDRLSELIKGDRLFRVEGSDKTVSYNRVSS
ncbi:MAG: cobalamin B12-binding domain-containing protein [Nitrospirae bacterium]|nr:cobalamin B12-binding domain-containing protein [Nitrospirota bacterium]